MLVISGSLPKAGSSWFLHLTNDLLVAAGHPDNKQIRDKFDLQFMKYDECNIQEPTPEKIEILTSPPVSEYTFAVKTHHPPNRHVLDLLAKGKIKITYIYRDPRDTAVSGLEAGRKLRARGVFERFGKIESMQDAIEWSSRQVENNWQRWIQKEGILYFRYEDLLRNPLEELSRLAGYLEIDVPEEAVGKIIGKHSAAR